MENIYEVVNEIDGSIHIVIERGNNEFTSMSKAHWDELQAKRESGEII